MMRSVFSTFSKSLRRSYPLCRFATAKDYEREIARRSMAELDSEKEAHEILFQRISNIIKNIADGQSIKVLQLYPESKNIIGALGKARNFEFTGISAYSEDKQIDHESKSKFAAIQYLDFDTTPAMPFDTNTFQVVLNLLPFTAKAPQASNPYMGLVNPEEILRVLNIPGYAIFGAPVAVWEHWDMTNQLQFLESGELIVVQWLKFNPSRINEHGGIIDNDREIVILRDETEDTPSEEYTVAVVQKVDRQMDAMMSNMVTKHKGDPREHPAKPFV